MPQSCLMATEQLALRPQRQNWDRSRLYLGKEVSQAELHLEGMCSPIPGAVQTGAGSLP